MQGKGRKFVREGAQVIQRKKHAFRQAPWRSQLRLTGSAALPVIGLLVVAGMYLAVNAKVANAGREVLTLEKRRTDLERANADLMTRLAYMTSPERLLERAGSMGFEPAGLDDIEYVQVPGWMPPPEFVAPSPPSTNEPDEAGVSPAFTETWGEWLSRWLGGGGAAR